MSILLQFIVEFNCERILKICQHLPKLCLKLVWLVFFDSQCNLLLLSLLLLLRG